MSSFRLRLVAAAALPLLLLLTSCGDDTPEAADTTGAATSATASPSASTSSDALATVQVEGGSETTAPTLAMPTPLTVTAPEHRVVKPGTGETITAEHKVALTYVLANGRDGKTIESAWGNKPVTLSLGQVPQFAPVVGQKVGAQVLIAIPAKDAFGDQGNDELGVRAEDTLLYLIQPVSVSKPLTEAEGTAVPPKEGLPTVQMGATPKDPATFSVPAGDPPKETVAQPLIVGAGPKVVAGQTVRVSYTGATWREPTSPFDYSGKSEQGWAEFRIGQGQLIKAWDENLVGQPVGTRLLLVVPPADGYGAAGSGEKIRGTDTLIFVIDILDAS